MPKLLLNLCKIIPKYIYGIYSNLSAIPINMSAVCRQVAATCLKVLPMRGQQEMKKWVSSNQLYFCISYVWAQPPNKFECVCTWCTRVQYFIITQQMDNVARSCLLAMANVAMQLSRWNVSQWIVGELAFDAFP